MQVKSRFNLLRTEEWLPLLLLLFVFALAYLPHINQFGFYKDDWHMIYNGHTFGPNRITDSFLIDRPIMGRINSITYRVLGDSPLAWSLFAFAARLAGVLAFYWLARLLWPGRRFAALAMSLLFAVYPGFLQLPNAATFQNHFIGYGSALVSIVLSAAALRARGWRKAGLVALAMLGAAGYMLIYEYMIGLEGLRLAVLVYLLRRDQAAGTPWRKTVRQAARAYLPYLLVAGGFVFWRLILFSSNRPATNSELLWSAYLAAPGAKLAELLANLVKDTFETVWMAWSVPLYNLWSSARPADLAVGLLLGAAGALALFFFARRFPEGQDAEAAGWERPAMLLGGLGVLFALLPVLAAGRSVSFKDQFDRYTLHATAGVCLLLGGLLFGLLRPRLRLGVLVALVGLALPVHYLNGVYWSNFWQVQRDFWWQVVWRAPALQDDTLLMANLPPGFRLAEDYEIFSAANLVYHPEERSFRLYGEVLNAATARQVVEGGQSYRFIRFFEFTRDFSKVLLVDWPGAGTCAHFIDGNRMELPGGADSLDYWVGRYSHIERVVTDAPPAQPLAAIFGREPAHGWCYYFQQADLARQRGDWLAVAHLFDQAQAAGMVPTDAREWLPFYQAFSALDDQAQAEKLAGLIRADRDALTDYCVVSDPGGALRADPAAMELCGKP